ncbi:MAG: hypothetical protein JWM10_4448 [Myxococcaceae bacterium]|nr:hypothetical protein [Myxococcaceae bacterium]
MRTPVVFLPLLLAACSARFVTGPATVEGPDAAVDAPPIDAPIGTPINSNCIPGVQIACACPGGVSGVQVCAADGRAFGPCACPDAGVTATMDVGTGCAAPVADPPRDGTSCAPPTGSGGATPYYQCTTANVCPRGRFANDPMLPGFRVTYLKITQPAALASAAILNTINPTLARGSFLWGLQLNLAAGVFRTGGLQPTFARGAVGLGLMDGRFAFYNGNGPGDSGAAYNPLPGPISVMGDRVTTAMLPGTVLLPVFSDAASTQLLTVLPLDNLRMTVRLAPDRGCIGGGVPTGGRYTESTSRWATEDACDAPYGSLVSDLTVERARTVSVTIGGSPVPLCNVIAGANCATDPMASWARQPDSSVDGQPAWRTVANFAAISADIAR